EFLEKKECPDYQTVTRKNKLSVFFLLFFEGKIEKRIGEKPINAADGEKPDRLLHVALQLPPVQHRDFLLI
uniref:hypothetical protein n=1 Tax=Prevotella heparinolytica TaxID=28113 RepID=UPI0035A0F7A9